MAMADAKLLLGHSDRFRSPICNDPVNILLVGADFDKFEISLISHIKQVLMGTVVAMGADVDENVRDEADIEMVDLVSSTEEENVAGPSTGQDNAVPTPPPKLTVRISKLPTISKEVIDAEEGVEEIIDYIIILINPMIPSCLQEVEKMLEFIDPVFLARKRVDFVLVKKSSDVSEVSREQMKFFCCKYKVYFKAIFFDMDDSIQHHASMCSQKLRRILINPLVF